jgi:hypothetical protein
MAGSAFSIEINGIDWKARLYSKSPVGGVSPCTIDFSLWLAWKVTTLRALIGIDSPVRGIAPGPRRLAPDVEVAKTRQLDILAVNQGAVNDVEEGFDHVLGLALVQPQTVEQPSSSSSRTARLRSPTSSPDPLTVGL